MINKAEIIGGVIYNREIRRTERLTKLGSVLIKSIEPYAAGVSSYRHSQMRSAVPC